FALKHYFVVVPVLLELWLIVRRRADWRPIRPETVVLAGAALAYGLSIALFAKGFFDVIVPMVGLAYENFRYSPISLLLSKNPVLWSLGIVGLILLRPSEPRLFSLPALQ